MSDLPTRFNFKEVDEKWSRYWEEKNLFHAQPDSKKDPYTIVIPPPNVTGILHMGHALNNTLQDIIIRFKRMQGHETLWMPGTDHAGIATQNVVEKQLAKDGKKRQDVGRDAFLERLWGWKKEYGDTIIHQLKKLGSSCDWPRTRFTMDDNYSYAVKEVFVRLYEKGLIYQGEYIINWCPRCHTALSDEEAEHQDTKGNLYYIKYPFKDEPNKYVTVATTRPETMLGDTAVAVNPDDKRYKDLIGKTLILPLIEREIKIIADEFVDPKFGTGAVKVTPAHDPNDFMMGKRHNLEFINIMHPDAALNKNAGDYEGMDRFEGREAIIEELRLRKLLENIKAHDHAVGHCYRCHTVVEPYLSKQWFVKMKPLAEPAVRVVKNGKVKFYPERWTKVYMNWMENIRDWCISRQIWWGHRVPVWYCDSCPQGKNVIVSKETPSACPNCSSKALRQDDDVLDTWFSSWLWPFATLGWPKKNKDLEYFYPTSSLFTAPEIIFFWVARMIMAGLEFMDDIPFSDVYIHGTVRDSQGRKMSKSLGNAIDPLEIIKEYGADALRFSLIINSGQDLFISKEKFEIGRNFANKIWNAARLIMMNANNIDPEFEIKDLDMSDLNLPTKWIISRLNSTLKKVTAAIENYKFSEAETLIYEFFWSNFCDWYLEIAKDSLGDVTVQNTALKILETSLKMMHPFIPFVTEEIWSNLNEDTEICVSKWPEAEDKFINKNTEKDMQKVIDLVTSIRNTRAQWSVKPSDKLSCFLISSDKKTISLLKDNENIIMKLANIKSLTFEKEVETIKDAATSVLHNIKCIIPLGDIIDISREKEKIEKEITQQKSHSENLSLRLKNEKFVNKAPKDVVEKEKLRLKNIEDKINELQKVVDSLN